MTLALAICEICPPSEADGMIAVLLNLFDTRSSLMSLLKTMIDLEISRTGRSLSNLNFYDHLSLFAPIQIPTHHYSAAILPVPDFYPHSPRSMVTITLGVSSYH